MRVLVTGASGFIGSAVVRELVGAKHEVVGLARSDAGAAKIEALGVAVARGDLTDVDSLRRAASASDGVVHCAFSHDDFADRANNLRKDREALVAMSEVLEGKPLVFASGIGGVVRGRVVTEDDVPALDAPDRAGTEANILALASRGVRVASVRLPPTVHGDGDHGFVPMLIGIARTSGTSGYVGDGANRWPAVHRLDAARLFRLALERAPAGSAVHAIGDEGISTRDIAAVIGAKLGVPVASVEREHFGWLGNFFSLDVPASSALTQQRFEWKPTEVGLLADLEHGRYF
jgi:nucleoside-diphosphate-sugar epimerase